jgi:hypothetical protein
VRVVALLVALTLLASPVLAAPDGAQGATETRLFWLHDCPVGDPIEVPTAEAAFLPALLTALIAPLVSAVVDLGVAALQEAAKDKDFPLPAPPAVEERFYAIGSAGEATFSAKIQCVALVRGRFGLGKARPDDLAKDSTELQRLAARFRGDSSEAAAGAKGAKAVHIVGEPDLYFEARVLGSPDGSKFALRPQALHVGKFFAAGSAKPRHYALTLTFVDAYENEPFASVAFRFEGVTTGKTETACLNARSTEYCGDATLGGSRGWFQTKPLSPELAAEIAKRKGIALAVNGAARPWAEPAPAPVPDAAKTPAALESYCREVDAENADRLPSRREYDAECPAALATARALLESARQRDALNLRWKAGAEMWTARCGPLPDANEPDPPGRAAECLKAIQPPITAGQFQLRATAIETRPGSKVAKFFAPLAVGAAPAAKSALVEAIDPAKRAAAKQAKEAAKRGQRVAIARADLEVQIAEVGVATAAANGDESAVLKAQLALLEKQVAANAAYRAAGLEVPFPEVD